MRLFASFWLVVAICVSGCKWTRSSSTDSPSVIRGTSQGIPKKLAIPGQIPATRLSMLDEPSAFIPPPPDLELDEPKRDVATTPEPFKPAEPVSTKPETPVKPVSATVPAEVTNPVAEFKRLVQRSQEAVKNLDGFEAILKRREVVDGNKLPEELLQFRFRKAPLSVHFKWIGTEGNGRELVYATGKFNDRVHILTAKGDGFVLMPAKKRLDFAIDDSNIKSKSRYDLKEGGMLKSIDQLGRVLQEVERDPKSNADRIRYLGKAKRPEYAGALEGIDEYIPPKWEPLLPKGGRRQSFFDSNPDSPTYGLPLVIVAQDHMGREVEYYHFDKLKLTRFTDADFDPDRLFKK